ncbi:MAG: phosphate acyltransferase, partial [Lachnospiraceae bacterium]|nr:phosphate acyltransferase [Lachnospiraceae bacterium]
AKMGSLYMENICKTDAPKVGIVNIGAEEEKGNALVKETFPLLKECADIHFAGSVEARDIPKGNVDVIVCEAFAGNIILKLYEGLAGTLLKKIKTGMMSTFLSKIGAGLAKKAIKNTLKSFDVSEYGGAPLLGLKGLVVKTHGSSTHIEIYNSIKQCVAYVENDINSKIKNILSEEM